MTDNRFDFIRLFLAASVLVYHGVALGAAVPFSQLELRLAILAEVAIQGFFIVSGLLVAGSLQRSKTIGDYTGKRIGASIRPMPPSSSSPPPSASG